MPSPHSRPLPSSSPGTCSASSRPSPRSRGRFSASSSGLPPFDAAGTCLRPSSTIETNAAPSVEYLGRGGVGLRRLRQLLYDGLALSDGHSLVLQTARSQLAALEQDVGNYLRLTPLPGEGELWDELRADLRHATDIARSILEAEEARDTSTANV